ncbi:MAG TPA: BON domain-containing protein [Terriglobales bacterium]|nr:BON domain-containing protein [Terriglobales bacterium]
MTSRYLSPIALSCTFILVISVAAQEPVWPQAKENKPQPQQQSTPAAVQPETPPKADSQSDPTAAKPENPNATKPTKPEPPRKGAIQNVETTSASNDAGKGSTTNLGTDIDAVRQNIEAAFQKDPTLKGTPFTVTVTNDTVELTGVANSGRERTAARRIAQSFAGNLRVKDRITVAGVTPSTPEVSPADKTRQQGAEADADAIAKPESDEPATPARKANKPKKEPAKHGDQATEDPRDPRKKS